jgi:hypothetical protein
MKRKILVFSIIAVILNFIYLPNAFNQNGSYFLPAESNNVFIENGQEFVYQSIDSVYVTMGFYSYNEDEIILDITIDNQGSDTLHFDPQSVYMFRYSEDTLEEKRLYYALDPETVLDSIQYSQYTEETRLKRNVFFSILAGAAYITAEIAGIAGDVDYDMLEAVRFTHDVVQIGLDYSRHNTHNKLYNLDFAGDYWIKGAIRETQIYPDSFENGKLHFVSPKSQLLKIYVPIEDKLYRFTFKSQEI